MSSAVFGKVSTHSAGSATAVLSAPPMPAQLAEQVETADGARAIEVAALFDDAVLDVRHFDNPAAGRPSRLSRLILGTAGAALLGTCALFGQSYLQVAAEKAQEEKGLRPHSHRESGGARDVAAGGLLFYGIGAMLYGLHRLSSERRENAFTIGGAADATFQVTSEGLPSERFPLVRSNGTDYEFLFTSTMAGELAVDGKTTPLGELAQQAQPATGVPGALALPIPEGARLSVSHGSCSFLVRSVARPRHYPTPLRIDWSTQSYTGAVLAGAAAMMGLMFAVPPDPRSLALDSFTNQQLAHYLVKAPEVKDEQVPWLKKEQEQKTDGSRGQAAKDKSGRSGKTDAPKQIARLSIAGPKDNPDPKMSRKMAEDAARNVGIVGLLHSGTIKGLSSLMGSDSALGNEAENALGNLDGRTVGDAFGNNGMGFVGVGTGADGTGDNTIGSGPWGPIGIGTGPRGYGRPTHVAKLKDRQAGPPDWKLGPPEMKGDYDKELIRRVIRQHMNEVKFCYERELTRDNSLSGRVVVKFAINGMGSVASSFIESSTLHNPSADNCIAGAVRRWNFPKPQSGIVLVSYPFLLKSATASE